jgi:hypothetical protein
MIAIIDRISLPGYGPLNNGGNAMHRKHLLTIVSSALILASGLAMAQQHGHQDHKTHASADTRVLVPFPVEPTEHTLTNMRDHLSALQEISDALARGHNYKAAKVAESRLGMTSLRLHGAHQVAKFMPQGMQDAGTAMHRAASRFAIEAQNAGVTGDLKPALGVFSEVMSACVGCHAGYRLK